MICTHHDITGKFNYFRCIKRKKDIGDYWEFEEEIFCTQCHARFIPKPEEKGECEHEWCYPQTTLGHRCKLCGVEKANQGGEKDLEICPKCDKVKYIAKSCECEGKECINAPQRCLLGYWCKWCREHRIDVHLNDEAAKKMQGAITNTFGAPQKPSEEEREWRKAVVEALSNKTMAMGFLQGIDVMAYDEAKIEALKKFL